MDNRLNKLGNREVIIRNKEVKIINKVQPRYTAQGPLLARRYHWLMKDVINTNNLHTISKWRVK